MPCCSDGSTKNVDEEIKEIQSLLAQAYVRADRLKERVKCRRCLSRIVLLVEGLEIFSKMNFFADAYRETSDKWRDWIQRMSREEGLEVNNQP